MSYNGSGTFNINSAGQPVVTGTVISSTTFNALTADLGTGLTTAITKDGQTATTARIPFAAGIDSSLTTDATSIATGSIITAGGVGVAKALWVGGLANIAGVLTTIAQVITSASANAFAVGRVGTTNPAFNIDASTALSETGVNIKSAAAAGGVAVSVLSSGANEALTVNAKGSGTIGIGNVSTGAVTITPATTISGATTLSTTLGVTGVTTLGNGAILGTPASATLTNATGLPISSGVSGLGTGVATALAVNVGSAGAPVVNGGALGTPSSGTVTNLTGTASININGTVGATTPAAVAATTLSASGVTTVQAGSVAAPAITTSGDTNTGIFFPAADTIAFSEGGAEAARINSSGALLVGCTANPSSTVAGKRIEVGSGATTSSSGTDTAGYSHITFINGNGSVGSIQTSASATSYVTSSDYRLKDNVAPMIGALAKVAALKPVTYKWKSDGSNGQGFIAHELQEVVPDCVTGEKDAVDSDGNAQYQGVDTSFLVATLVASIQELKTIIDAQATRIAALERV